MKNRISIYILLWMIRVSLSLSEKLDEPIYTYDIDSVPLERCDDKSYRCHDGSCIDEQYYCNGMLDCIGGEDEEKCGTCPFNFCSCADGLCSYNLRSCNNSPSNCSKADDNERYCVSIVLTFYTPQKRCMVEDMGSDLWKIDCSGMELITAPCPDMIYFQSIHILILNNNKLGLFDGLSKRHFGNDYYASLRILELDKNEIKDLPTIVFQGMDGLKHLSLADNQIEYLNETGFPESLYFLKKLNLTRNSITTVAPGTFSSLFYLESLDLSHNQIEIIANQTFYPLRTLTALYLDSNKITKLEQNMFTTLKNLSELRLQRNRISIIENNNAFIGLNNLKILDLSHNKLTQLVPETFRNLNNITTLILSNNNVAYMHEDTFENLLGLQELYINKNHITIAPHVFSISNLADLSENDIEVIANHSFSHLSVDHLYLNHNKLKTLKSEMFSNATINKVDLSNNQISVIEKRTFSGLKYKDEIYDLVFTLSINFNNLTKLTSDMFEGLIDLQELQLKNNKISSIEDNVFQPLSELRFLDLSFNALSEVTSNTFRGPERLLNLWLQDNKIKSIENESFYELPYLIELDLSNNFLTEIHANMLPNTITLNFLYLQNNKIENMHMNVFENSIALSTLNLSHNHLSTISANTLQCLEVLQNLYLQENKIEKIEINTFNSLWLIVLDLSSNQLAELESGVFSSIPFLRTLYVQRNRIKNIEEIVFKNLKHLKTLNLKNNMIGEIGPNLLKGIRKLDLLIVDEYRFCCLKNKAKKCESPKDEFSSCEDLMKNTLLRMFVWILGVVAIVANSFVIIFRMRYQSANTNKVNSFLIKNLAMSDIFMGVYLLIIASMDTTYRGEYYIHDFIWRHSFWCNLAGFLSTFSSELTVFILTVLSIDRLYVTKFPFRANQRGSSRIKKLMMIVWVVAAIIALIPLPLFNIVYFGNFYGRSGVCLPLHITTDTPNGWQYSVFVFIILNAISFAIIAINYIVMYRTTARTRRSVTSSNQSSGSVMAFRMTLLVLADAACWIPIIALGIRSLMGVTLSPDVYPWIAVFVLPLNAALNPLLYTISSIPMVIKVKFPKTRLNGRLVFNWQCHWVAANESTKSDINTRIAKI